MQGRKPVRMAIGQRTNHALLSYNIFPALLFKTFLIFHAPSHITLTQIKMSLSIQFERQQAECGRKLQPCQPATNNSSHKHVQELRVDSWSAPLCTVHGGWLDSGWVDPLFIHRACVLKSCVQIKFYVVSHLGTLRKLAWHLKRLPFRQQFSFLPCYCPSEINLKDIFVYGILLMQSSLVPLSLLK